MVPSDVGLRQTGCGAVTWRGLRNRFGIAAPRVAVRAHVPWYWRALATGLVLSLSVAFGAWLYDLVREVTGRDGHSPEQVRVLRERIVELEHELVAARSSTSAGGSALQIERTTQEELARQVKLLEEEKARLREDLALFENLAATEAAAAGLTIRGLHVEPDKSPGQYRYRLLVALQGPTKEREFKGSLQLAVSLRRGDKNDMLTLPAAKDPDRQRFALSFRHFRRVEGTFQVPEGTVPISVEVRLLQDGATKASQSVTL